MGTECKIRDCYEFIRARVFLILWISLVLYISYDTFVYYRDGRQFYYLRRILGLGLCISRATATVLNVCGALILLPQCKKLNQLLYRILAKLWPRLFFFWLEKAKSFHMTVATTLVLFGVLHSISHFLNLWNFSRGYDEERREINFANYRNENPLLLLMSITGISGVLMLLIILCMGVTSLRIIRRKIYNAFWYSHQLYLPFMVMFLVHPLSGVLKKQLIIDDNDEISLNPSQIDKLNNSTDDTLIFVAIESKTLQWMLFPLTCFFIDLIWRIFSRNRAVVDILEVKHMPGRTLNLSLSCPDEQFSCRPGQYVVLQCPHVSLIEWHPFTVVSIPTSYQRNFGVWIRVKGDWTETLEKIIKEKGPNEIRLLVDGPFSSPMEGVSGSEVAICVAAGVGITPFVPVLQHILQYPRSRYPGRIHLLWIVRHEQELKWLAKLANKIISQLRTANRPDRLHFQFYITNNTHSKSLASKEQNSITHMVVINEKGCVTHVLRDEDDENLTLLTPNLKRNRFNKLENVSDSNDPFNVAREYPLLGCRVKRGRPHWDRVFGYWVHLYPDMHLNLYCCGPKKLVRLLKTRCAQISRNTKTKFTFVHEGFS